MPHGTCPVMRAQLSNQANISLFGRQHKLCCWRTASWREPGRAMNRKFVILSLSVLTSIATGCGYKKVAPATAPLPMALTAFAGSPQRYIAERHKLEVITTESELQKSWEMKQRRSRLKLASARKDLAGMQEDLPKSGMHCVNQALF